MAKRLFLLLFSGLIGIIASPEILAAADSFQVGTPDFHAVETIEILETVETIVGTDSSWEKTEEKVAGKESPKVVQSESLNIVKSAKTTISQSQYVVEVAHTSVVNPYTITIAGRTLDIVNVNDTLVDSGDHVNRYGDKFFYGHNSAGVFGGIVNVGVGGVFTITENGVSKQYKVAKVVIFEKNSSLGTLQLNGSGSYMNSVAKAKSDGVYYDVSLMTCYGASYGNGDASHRYVIFANAI